MNSESKTVLVLRTAKAGRLAYNGFQWPELGPVAAPDWDPQPICGYGLHGALKGEGDGNLFYKGEGTLWQVVEVVESEIVSLEGKVKFPRGVVLYTGDQATATKMVADHHPGSAVIGVSLTGGRESTLTGGDWSTLTGGDYSTLTGGDGSTLTGGDGSTLTGGHRSTLTGGDGSTLTGGDGSTLTGGRWSTLTGGRWSTLTGGDGSTLTGGDWSTLTGGRWSTLTGGDGSTLISRWYDASKSKYRTVLAEVGEDGIEADVTYRVEGGKFVKVSP